MARHRGTGLGFRRKIAGWPLVVLGLVVVSVLGVLGYGALSDMVDRRADAEAENCSGGELVLPVTVTASLTEPVTAAAEQWNSSSPRVQNHCVRAEVHTAPSAAVADGLTSDEWDEELAGPRPAAWIPDSTVWTDRLASENNAVLGSQPLVVATSPVLLAVPAAGAAALQEGEATWETVGQMARGAGWGGVHRAEWGTFSLAVPDPAMNRASQLALQAVLATSGGSGSGPVTEDILDGENAQQQLAALAGAQPTDVPPTGREALQRMDGTATPLTGSLDAVPVAEVDLYRRNVGKDGMDAPSEPVVGLPLTPTPSVQYPLVSVKDASGDTATLRAAQRFGDYLTERGSQRLLADAGFRVASVTAYPDPSPGLSWTTPMETLKSAERAVTSAVTARWRELLGS
ncbi:substrate-binding domain-containing protein [Actinoalloteichus spitiensis]|uniref:substrate-binding domain-containing protein n=1 Tax=Actinoalloteichus spitiensis TaxID=252394 RepID=UPI00036781EE|nr:substrate-binding domain-containing protein [Actinoalloteichus spitiensis]